MGKVRFTSPALANQASKRGRRVRKAYRCPRCGGWHLAGSFADQKGVASIDRRKANLVRAETVSP